MSSPPNLVFHPAEGSLLDLESLLAIAQGPSRLLSAWMGLHLPAGGGVVLSGLEPEGSLMDLVTPGKGAFGAVSPGVVRPRLTPEGLVTLRPGAALVMTREGAHQLVRVTEPVAVRPPAPSKMIHKPVLVMIVETRPGGAEDLPAGGRQGARRGPPRPGGPAARSAGDPSPKAPRRLQWAGPRARSTR